jgi:hypothetical protein
MGYKKPQRFPIEQYRDVPEGILVRRHRSSNWREAVLRRADELAKETDAYAWDRVLQIIVSSLGRFAPQLKAISELRDGPDSFGSNVKRFVANLHVLFGVIHQAEQTTGTKRICVDFVHDAFDVTVRNEWDANDEYLGLVVPRRGDSRGLLSWAASTIDFVDFLGTGADTAAQPVDENLDDLIRELYSSTDVEISRMPFPPGRDVSDEELRRLVIGSADLVLRSLGWGAPLPVMPHQHAPKVLAAYLLDELLTHRFILSQSDIATTLSLYDAGMLDTSGIGWTYSLPS